MELVADLALDASREPDVVALEEYHEVNIRVVGSAICGLAQLAAPVVLGGPSSTMGTYSNSWSPPSKVRLSTSSSRTSG